MKNEDPRKSLPLEMPNLYKAAMGVEMANLVDQISALDFVITQYNDQLEKAQPLFSGKVLVRFSKKDRVRLDGEIYYEQKPCVGKMIKTRYGWRFLWMNKPDIERLHEYRVGKGLKGDAVVVRLLKHLSEMLLRRESMVAELKKIRTQLSKSRQSVMHFHEKKIRDLELLMPRIAVDWTKDADSLYKSIRTTKPSIP